MACIAFIASLVVCGALGSLLPVNTLSSQADQPDYHFVPFAGDAWGSLPRA